MELRYFLKLNIIHQYQFNKWTFKTQFAKLSRIVWNFLFIFLAIFILILVLFLPLGPPIYVSYYCTINFVQNKTKIHCQVLSSQSVSVLCWSQLILNNKNMNRVEKGFFGVFRRETQTIVHHTTLHLYTLREINFKPNLLTSIQRG